MILDNVNNPRDLKRLNLSELSELSSELRELVLDMFSKERVERQGFFNYDYLARLIDEHLTHRRDHRKLLWTLLVFQLWYDAYVERAAPST